MACSSTDKTLLVLVRPDQPSKPPDTCPQITALSRRFPPPSPPPHRIACPSEPRLVAPWPRRMGGLPTRILLCQSVSVCVSLSLSLSLPRSCATKALLFWARSSETVLGRLSAVVRSALAPSLLFTDTSVRLGISSGVAVVVSSWAPFLLVDSPSLPVSAFVSPFSRRQPGVLHRPPAPRQSVCFLAGGRLAMWADCTSLKRACRETRGRSGLEVKTRDVCACYHAPNGRSAIVQTVIHKTP